MTVPQANPVSSVDVESAPSAPESPVLTMIMESAEQSVPEARESPPLTGVVIGRLEEVSTSGEVLVDFPGNRYGRLSARSTVPLSVAEVRREVALLFENGDPCKPLVLGLIQHPEATPLAMAQEPSANGRSAVEAHVDKEQLVFTAEKEIVLRCGEASITLTRAGKVLIRGKYLLSRSSGVNRIKGGSVQIN